MEEVERRWGGGTYFYPAPTASGLQRLREGRLRGKCAVSGWNAGMMAARVDNSLELDITLWALCG